MKKPLLLLLALLSSTCAQNNETETTPCPDGCVCLRLVINCVFLNLTSVPSAKDGTRLRSDSVEGL